MEAGTEGAARTVGPSIFSGFTNCLGISTACRGEYYADGGGCDVRITERMAAASSPPAAWHQPGFARISNGRNGSVGVQSSCSRSGITTRFRSRAWPSRPTPRLATVLPVLRFQEHLLLRHR